MKKRIFTACLLVIAVVFSAVAIQRAFPLAKTEQNYIEPQAKEQTEEQVEEQAEEKSFWEVNLDEDFDESSVLVVLDKRTGGINKRHEESFFGEFPKESIEDLTYMAGDIESRKYLDRKNFHQILQIKLPVTSKENVVQVIRQLEKIDGILWAGPNHYDSPMAQPEAAKPPNNTNYNAQWGLHGTYGIQAEDAWDIETGNGKVRVGVIDSGIDAHGDMTANS